VSHGSWIGTQVTVEHRIALRRRDSWRAREDFGLLAGSSAV
jgi:hypothetical protein